MQIEVQYTRPYNGRLPDYMQADRVQDVWEYHIKASDTSVYGFAGGYLRKVAGGWQARHFERTPWSAVCKNRELAILDILPQAKRAADKAIGEMDAKEKQRQDRYGKARQMSGWFSKGWHVEDTTAYELKPESYTVTLTGVSERQVQELAKILHTDWERKNS